MRLIGSGSIAIAATIVTVVGFACLRRPYPLIFAILSVAFVVQGFAFTKRPVWRNVLLSVGACLLVLSAAEVGLNHLEEWQQGSYTFQIDPPRARQWAGWDPHWQVDDSIGYRPVPDATVRVTKRYRGSLVYEARYGLDENGWRKVPGTNEDAKRSILFFGGSFTFGEGLNDDQTIPYFVANLLDGRYSVHSFAFGGYGAQEMLAILEEGLERDWMPEGQVPRFAIYLAVPHHVARVAGFTSWNRFGPRYVLDGDSVKRAGTFSDQDIVPRWANRFLMPSALMRRLYYRRFLMQPVEEEHVRLYARVVETAARLFESRYPGAEFHVAFFGSPETDWPKLDLPSDRIHRLWKALPPAVVAGTESPKPYFIPHDGHPTALTNRRVASFLVREAIGAEDGP